MIILFQTTKITGISGLWRQGLYYQKLLGAGPEVGWISHWFAACHVGMGPYSHVWYIYGGFLKYGYIVMILSTIYGLITYDNLISNHKNNCWVYCRSDLFVLYGSLWKLFLAGAHHLLILLILADSTVWLKSTTFRISWPLGREVLKRTEPNFSSCLSLMRRSPTPLKM